MAIYPYCLVCEDLVEDVLNLVNIGDQSAGPAQCQCITDPCTCDCATPDLVLVPLSQR